MFIDGGITMGQILTRLQEIQAKFLGKRTVFVETFSLNEEEDGVDSVVLYLSFVGDDIQHNMFYFRDWQTQEVWKEELNNLEEFIKKL